MSPVEQEFDLTLLSEAELAADEHPHLPLRLDVLAHADGEAGEPAVAVAIRTTPQALAPVVEKLQAAQLRLAERTHVAQVAFGPPGAELDPQAETQLLIRLRDGLERVL